MPILIWLALAYWTIVIVYRIFLSPLRNVPGPFFGRFSIGWQLWHTLRGNYYIAAQEVHQKYGELQAPYPVYSSSPIDFGLSGSCVRISHVEVSVSGPESVKTILMRPLNKHTWYKIFAIPDSSWVNQMSELNAQRFITFQKKIAGGYALSSVLKAETEIDHAIEKFEDQMNLIIASGCSIKLDVWFTYFAFDVVGQITFSQPFGFLKQGKDIEKCIATSHRLVPYLSIMAHFYQYHDILMSNPFMAWLDLQPMKHVMNTTKQAVQEREKNKRARNDMIEHWRSQKHSEPITERELLATANANVAAGADTVASELQAFFYLVLRNPGCLRRMRDELDAEASRLKFSFPVQYDVAQRLPYFQACVSRDCQEINTSQTTSDNFFRSKKLIDFILSRLLPIPE